MTLALLLFLLPLAYSPGPGNLFFAALGARFGLRATVPALAGYHLATVGITLAIGLGFATVLTQSPLLLSLLRWVGTGYVLWLALGIWRAGSTQGEHNMRPAGMTAGILLLLVNPKAYVIIALMFSQFLPLTRSGPVDILWITLLFTLNNLVAFCLWAALGERLAKLFATPHTAQRLNRGFGALLALVALWMLTL